MKSRTLDMILQIHLNNFKFFLKKTFRCCYSMILKLLIKNRPLNYSIETSIGSIIDSKVLSISPGKASITHFN